MAAPTSITVGYSYTSKIQCPVCSTVNTNTAPLFSSYIIYACVKTACAMVGCQIVIEKASMMAVAVGGGYGGS